MDQALTGTTIPGSGIWPSLDAPTGTRFVVFLLNVENLAAEKSEVTSSSFRMRDDLGRSFTLTDWPQWSTAHLTAKSFYGLNGLFDSVQPGMTELMVFVFWTPLNISGVYLERCPSSSGCGENATPAPNPTATPTTVALPPTIDFTRCAEGLFDWAMSFYISPLAKLNVEIYCGAHPDFFTGDSSFPISRDRCAEALYEWAISGFTDVLAELDVDLWC